MGVYTIYGFDAPGKVNRDLWLWVLLAKGYLCSLSTEREEKPRLSDFLLLCSFLLPVGYWEELTSP